MTKLETIEILLRVMTATIPYYENNCLPPGNNHISIWKQDELEALKKRLIEEIVSI